MREASDSHASDRSSPAARAFDVVGRVLSEPAMLLRVSGQLVALNQAASDQFGPVIRPGSRLDRFFTAPRLQLPDWLRLAAGSSRLIPGRFTVDGQPVFCEAAALRDGLGPGFVFLRIRRSDTIVQRIVALEERRRDLTHQSVFDPLTGLPGHGAFHRRWQALVQATDAGSRIGAIFFDIDHFKHYNDHFGHSAGDRCLRRVARVISQLANVDGVFAARIGGEEFAAVARAGDRGQLVALAERVRVAVARLEIAHGNAAAFAHVTLSAGVAIGRPLDHDGQSLLDDADAALYRAKAKGRNRIEIAGDAG